MKKISIIIPVYNESNTLEEILHRISDVDLGDVEKEIIIVNDGSTDATPKILEQYQGQCKIINHQKNQGKGTAIRTGLKAATGDYVIIQDADLEYDPQDIKGLIDRTESGVKVVYGSRMLAKNHDKNPKAGFFYYLGGVFLSKFTNFLYGTKLTDEATCYKLIQRELLEKLGIEAKRFEFCPEVTAKIARQGIKIIEVPISYHPRSVAAGKKIKLEDGIAASWTLIKYRFDWFSIRKFLTDYKWWLYVLLLFLAARLIIFSTFWLTSVNQGGWQNFYLWAQPSFEVLKMKFHETCDWHPPLYYTFTSTILYLFRSQLAIYFFQLILAWLSVVLSYKIARIFFNEKISRVVTVLLVIEPYWAWHNFLLVSENLSVPLLLAGFYYFFKFFVTNEKSNFYSAAAWFGLATLARPNNLVIVPLLSLLIFFNQIAPVKMRLNEKKLGVKQLIINFLIFNFIFLAILMPWFIHNKVVYNRFSLANIMSTNIYYYNLPPLISWQKNISYSDARNEVAKKADEMLGRNVGDQGNCSLFSRDDFNKQLNFYNLEAKKYIFANLKDYIPMHLIRAVPFFFQSGYFEMWSAYSGEFSKLDISGQLLKGNYADIFNFFKNINLKIFVYIFGIIFWGICSTSAFIALIYSYFYDQKKIIFFFVGLITILYTALIISPFVLARYRLPIYIFFLTPLIYLIFKIFNMQKLRIFIRKIPLAKRYLKLFYDYREEKKLLSRVDSLLSKSELPFFHEIPNNLSVGHEPTIRCNLRCKMCYQRETRNLRGAELDTKSILSIYDKLSDKMVGIKLVGGEPMVRGDIVSLIEYLNNNNKIISLQTNCTLFNQDNILKFEKFKNLKNIITSLDGSKEMHDSIRGVPGTFNRLEGSLKLIRQHLPWVKITVFATLLVDDNLDKMIELIDTCKQLKIETINILFEQVYSAEEVGQTKKILKNVFNWNEDDYRINTQTREPVFSPEIKSVELKKKLKAIRNYGFKHGCYVNFSPFNYYDNLDIYLGEENRKAFCLKLLKPEIRINQEGDVVWCDVIEKSFGNLVNKSVEEIWLSPEYQEFRKYLFTNSLPICNRCCKAVYRNNFLV